MKIVPWKSRDSWLESLNALEGLEDEMNRMFNLRLGRLGNGGRKDVFLTPAVDIIDEKDHIKVRADLPGMKKDDIEVSLDSGILTIKGEKKEEKEVKEKDYLRSERYYGAFHRSFTLPSGVDAQKVNAAYKDGVLEVLLPKKEEAKAKQVKVDVK